MGKQMKEEVPKVARSGVETQRSEDKKDSRWFEFDELEVAEFVQAVADQPSIKNLVDKGELSRDQAVALNSAVSGLRCEMLSAWLRGEDMQVWTRKLAKSHRISDGDTFDSESMVQICGFGDKVKKKPFIPGGELIGAGEWVKIKGGMTLDSGCSVFVMPSKWLMHLVLEQSEGSRRGQKFVAASDHSVKNEGQRTVKFVTTDGSRRQMIFQVTAVNKILASIAGICDNGNTVLFRRDGGTITNVETGRETNFQRVGNVYCMDMWVRNPHFKPSGTSTRARPAEVARGFHRPGR